MLSKFHSHDYPRYYPRRNKSERSPKDRYKSGHHSFMCNSRKLNQLSRPFNTEWVDKRFIHAVKYYTAMKKKRSLSHAPVWTDHTDLMLNERRQQQWVYTGFLHLNEAQGQVKLTLGIKVWIAVTSGAVIDWKGAQGNPLDCWNCSVSWLMR